MFKFYKSRCKGHGQGHMLKINGNIGQVLPLDKHMPTR